MRSTRKRKCRKRYGGTTPKRFKSYFGVPAPSARRRRAVVPTNESQSNIGSLISAPNPIYASNPISAPNPISVPNSRSTRSNPSQLYQPLTPPMSPRDYPSQFKYISEELGRVEKERDELLVKLSKFGSEIKELEKMSEGIKKKKEGEDFLLKIIAMLLKLNTISIVDVSRFTKEYMKLNDLVAKAFTKESSFEPLKKLIMEINDVQKKTTHAIRVKLNENMSGIKELLDKLGESNFSQIEEIFKEMGFHYEAVLTPELMRTPSPSPEGQNYREAKNKWLGKERQSKYRFKKGLPMKVDGRIYSTISSPSGRRTAVAAHPKKPGFFGTSDEKFNLAQPIFKRTIRNKAGSSTKKKKSN